MSNGNPERVFKLWSKITMMVVDRKRQVETVGRILHERNIAPRPENHCVYNKYLVLMMQWHDITARIFEESQQASTFLDMVCNVLQEIVELRFTATKITFVEQRNIETHPRPQIEAMLGHSNFEILNYQTISGKDLGPGGLTGLPQRRLSLEVHYREIK